MTSQKVLFGWVHVKNFQAERDWNASPSIRPWCHILLLILYSGLIMPLIIHFDINECFPMTIKIIVLIINIISESFCKIVY